MFDLVRPCVNCPFRKGQGQLFALSPPRLAGIYEGPAFQCHKTVDYSGDDPESGDKPQQCAGLMAVLHRSGEPNQIMQVASRLGYLELDALDPDGVAYASWDEAVAAHGGREP
jgi:hypothetical protein